MKCDEMGKTFQGRDIIASRVLQNLAILFFSYTVTNRVNIQEFKKNLIYRL